MRRATQVFALSPRWATALAVVATSMAIHASPVKATARTVALPVATQFVYPVGDPAIAPTYAAGNANGYTITQGFNTSCDPAAGQGFYYGGYYFCGHSGVDLSDQGYGGVVRAIAAGQVVFAGPDGSYGNMVRIAHLLADGQVVYSQYEHLGYGTVSVWYGEIVACGQQVGAVGDSGFAQGAHLHFEIKDSNSDGPGYSFGNAALLAGYYDPLAFLEARMPAPTPVPAPVATAVLVPLHYVRPVKPVQPVRGDREGSAILARFLHQYRYYVTVNTDALRLRSGPGLGQRQVGVVTRGTKVALLGVEGPWLRVALPENVTGWVYGSLVSGTIPRPFLLRSSRSSSEAVHRTDRAGGVAWQPRPRHPAAVQRPQVHRAAAHRPDIRRLGPLARVQTDGIRVHRGPSVDAVADFLAHQGSMVAVRTVRGDWARVTFTNGSTGWIMGQFLAMPHTAAPRRTPEMSPRRVATARVVKGRAAPADIHALGPLAQVLSDGVRVREDPRLSAGVLFLAYHGSMVAVRAVHVSWVRVTFTNGATGWILGHYLLMPHEHRAWRHAMARPEPSSARMPGVTAPHRSVRASPAGGDGQPARARYYTWAETLYVRDAPRLSGAVVALAGENTPVQLLGTHVSWSHIRLPNGLEGWALSHYVKDHRKIYLTLPAAG
jgi:murein DD-endopeptidase MepM/ murein hydrolase activator NlpD/SH3-like domain-containing protein